MFLKVVGTLVPLFLFVSVSGYSAEKFDARATATAIMAVIGQGSFAPKDEQGRVVTDVTSERGLDTLLDELDSSKVFLTQADVHSLKASWKDKLDDELESGSTKGAHEIFSLLITRMKEATAHVEALTEHAPDFTVNESYETAKTPPANASEALDRLRLRIKLQWLVLRTDGKKDAECAATIRKRHLRVINSAQYIVANEGTLFETYVTSVLRGLDPHSSYMGPDAATNFKIMLGGSLSGIGASLQDVDGMVTVMNVTKGSPAALEGQLKKTDVILAVGEGESGPYVDVTGQRLNDVVNLIRGKSGTKVRLKVLSRGASESKEIAVVRGMITNDEVLATGTVHSKGSYKLGVVKVPSFYRDMDVNGGKDKNVTKDVRAILEQMKKDNADAVVIDLRNNGGGSLTDAIDMTGLFIEEGPVVQIKQSNGEVEAYVDSDPAIVWEKPVVVLTNVHSASASEIFAGALKSYGRAAVIGDKTTHGKGSVQSAVDLGRIRELKGASGLLKFTTAQFYLPDGVSTQEVGVPAHVVLESLYSIADNSESTLPYHLPASTIKPATGLKAMKGFWNPSFAETLAKASKARTLESDKYKEFIKSRTARAQMVQTTKIPLEEMAFKSRSAEVPDEADKDEEQDEAPEKDPQFDELLQISADYLELLGKAQ
jgi:carboxyl-terminal processing protease